MISDRRLYEQTPALLQAVDASGHLLAVSDRWLTWLGYSRPEVIGQPWQHFLTAQSQAWIASAGLDEGGCRTREDVPVQFQNRAGQVLDGTWSTQPVHDERGRLSHWLAVITDAPKPPPPASNRSHPDSFPTQPAEATLRQYERLIAANPDPVCLIDRNYRYRMVNRAFQAWARPQCDLVGQTIADCFGEAFFTQVSKPRVDRALAGQTQWFEEWAHNPAANTRQFISITYAPYYDADGQIAGVINSIRDLTALKRTRDRLVQTTERLKLHIHNSPLAVIEWDANLRVQTWSTRAEDIFGLPPSAAVGQHFTDLPLFAAEDIPNIYQHLEGLIQSSDHHQTVLTRMQTPPGREVFCEWYNSVLVDEQGSLISVLSLVQDVTERQRAQIARRESEERWQLALLGSNEGIWDWQIPTDELFYSPRWKELVGYTDAELSNTHATWQRLVHPDDRPPVEARMRAHLHGETPHYSAEYRMRHKAGHDVWILSRGRAVFDETGAPIRFVGSHTDISDRKHAELALQASQNFMQLVFDNLPQRVFWKDQEGRFLGCNPAFARDMGQATPAQVVGKTDAELLALTPESLQQFRGHDRAVLEASEPRIFPEQIQDYLDGSKRWVTTTKLPLKTAEGAVIGIFGTYEDVTDRVLARASLQRYARMVGAAKDGMCLLDSEFRHQLINHTYRDWYGYGNQPIVGQTVAAVLGQKTFEQRLKPLLQRCLNGETIRYADWFEYPPLGRRFRGITLTPYIEESGDIIGIVATISDLTNLKESEAQQQQLLEIIEATSNFVGIASPNEEIQYANPALKSLLTANHGEGDVPRHLQQCHPQWALDILREEAIPTATQRGTWQGEMAILSANGQEIPVSQTITAHLDEYGEIKLLSTIAHDIRPQKTLERELRKRLEFEQLLSRISAEFVNLPSGSLAAGITQALQTIAQATQADRSYVYLLSADLQTGQLFSQWQADPLDPIPEDWQTIPAAPFQWWMSLLTKRQAIVINDTATMPPDALNEKLAVAAVGTRALAVVPMHHSGHLIGYIGFSVTHPKEWSDYEVALLRLVGDLFANAYQRQQAEATLRRQEHYFRSLTEHASDIVMLLDATGRCQYITPAVSRLLGYAPEVLVGQTATSWMAIADGEAMQQTLQKAMAHPGVSQPTVQFRWRHRNQQWRYFEAIATSLLTDSVVQGIVVNCRDVSDRVVAEAARQRSEQVFEAIFKQSAISMAQIALDGTYIRVNPAFCQLVGYRADELIGENDAKVTHPEDLSYEQVLSQEVAIGKVPSHVVDKRFVCADGSVRHVQTTVTAVHGDDGQPIFLSSVYNDVTEQVIAERALRSIVEGTAAVIGDDFFPVLARQLADSLAVDHVLISQLDNADQLSTLVAWHHPSQGTNLTYRLLAMPCERVLSEGFYCCPTQVQQGFPEDHNLADWKAESYLGVALKGQNGQLLGVLSAIHSQPIHNLDNAVALLRIFAARASAELERQRSIHALQASETNWRRILDNMPILLDAVDENGLITLWNKECERVTGYSAEEMIGNPHAFALLYPDDDYRQSLASSWGARGSYYRDWEWTITCKDGSERIISWSNLSKLFPIPDLGSWRVGVDVTERHLAEKALRKSEARFQRLAVNMPGVVYRFHQQPDGCDYFSYVSPGSATLWEITPEEAYADADRVWSVVHPEDLEAFKQSIAAAIAQNQPWFHEHRIITPAGQQKWLQAVAKAQHKADGSYQWDGILIDVTARKEAEIALQASQERFQRLAENMPGIVYRYHLEAAGQEYFSYLSPACHEIWEIAPEVGLRDIGAIWTLVHPEDRPRFRAALIESRSQATPLFENYRIVTPRGAQKWLQVLARPVNQPDGSCLWDGIITDITEQRATQAALLQSESLNRAILEALPDLLIRMRRDGLCLDMQYPESFNVVCPRDRHVGRYIQDTLEPDVAQRRLQVTARALSTGDTQIYEYQLLVHGQCRWEEARIVPMSQEEVLILIRDVDDRKRAEEALRESEALNRAIVGALPDMLIRMTDDGICLNAQHPDSFFALVPGEQAIGRRIGDMLPPELVAERLACTHRALTTGETQVCEYQIPVNGQLRWEESRIVPLMDDQVLVLVRDVDERRSAEKEVRRLNQVLEEQNQHLEELVELRTAELMTFMNALPDQIFVIDRATNQITFGNEVVVTFTEKQHRYEYEGKTNRECFEPERAAYYDAQNQQVFESGKILHLEEAIDTEPGPIYLDTYKIPLKRPDGEVYALIGTSRDVTELVKTRQTLETQAIQLEATNQELQSFSYSVSHDLRAPLRHVNGFIAALKQHLAATMTAADPKVDHYIEVIETSSHKMGMLIDGLLTLSRVGRREMTRRTVPLAPLVEHAIALTTDDFHGDPDQLQITVEALPTVQGDPTLLQQVFSNLIGNAVKFSRDRSPAIIHIGQRPEDGAIFIRDNGVGFDMTYADKLFSPFQRLHKQEEFQGTGIGLAIVNRIIHRHGGQIWAESAIGEGATFYFILPIENAPSELLTAELLT